MSADHHLAQANFGRMLAPLDSPALAGFAAALDPVNALADAAPGFVWRLQDDAGNATSFRPFDDDLLHREHERVGVGRGPVRVHLPGRPPGRSCSAAGSGSRRWTRPTSCSGGYRRATSPTSAEAKERLDLLRRVGPSPAAFTFRALYPVGASEPVSVAPPPGNVSLGRRPLA